MSKLILTASLLAVLAIAACSLAAAGPTAVPAVPPSPTAAPSAEPSAVATPTVEPTVGQPVQAPGPAIVEFTPGEIYLSDGIRRGAMDCEPVRDELPAKAVAGIECLGEDWFVARIGYYLFDTDADMLEAYTARMQAEGVTLGEGSCFDGVGDQSYVPGPEESMSRQGCFITAEGVANYRALLPGVHVYVGVVGHNIGPSQLEDFAWLGNQDVPGSPTLWTAPGA